MTRPFPRATAPVERALGALLILFVVWRYSGHGTPPGHPWSGLTLTLLGLLPLLWPSSTWRDARSPARSVVLALALASAGVWLWTAVHAAPPSP